MRSLRNRKALIALDTQKKVEGFIGECEGLARAAGLTLRFASVCEPDINNSIYVAEAYAGSYSAKLLASIEESAVKASEKRLNEVLGSRPHERNVVYTRIIDGLVSDAMASRSSMIVVNADHRSYKYLPQGFSTSLGLMAESPLPVMVLPKDRDVEFNKAPYSVLIADDLTEGCQQAVTMALEFAGMFDKAHVVHIHVLREKEDMRRYIQKVVEAMNFAKIPYDPEMSEERFMEKSLLEVKDRLSKRADVGRSFLDPFRHTYTPLAVFSENEKSVLEQVVKEENIDLAVFGRHAAFHRKEWTFGKMPFRLMLELKTPIMVIPPASTALHK